MVHFGGENMKKCCDIYCAKNTSEMMEMPDNEHTVYQKSAGKARKQEWESTVIQLTLLHLAVCHNQRRRKADDAILQKSKRHRQWSKQHGWEVLRRR